MTMQTATPLGRAGKTAIVPITIKRIELFVFPVHAPEPGFRICLRLTTDLGHDWGELFIKKCEKPKDWVSWGSVLLRFIGPFQIEDICSSHPDTTVKDSRIYTLLLAAAEHCNCPSRLEMDHHDHVEEGVFFNQAISYISLF
ncbi:hypothetical protein FHS16_004341 [Paenibacillus endophyticus]|uniref:Uncharacterized protein n=1 Tax=Paenibacillus endophyticus TaxID=1294268 RepID=A0A7W5CBQ9_9BACL|nr:hypothetical protein [Paenibacillus endophyticus]MBB3154259.1 hypothetical protein [Paenibacillus endophyticus]